MLLSKALRMQQDLEDKKNEIIIEGLENKIKDFEAVAELPELFQLKCPSPALEARPHLNGNNPSIPRI
jgi:hypothetical protein